MNVPELHQRASREFGERARLIGDDQWDLPTPCSEWDVRALVRHLVYENLWTLPIMEGQTMEEVGDRFEGDILGDDPVGAFDATTARAIAAVHAQGAMDRTVHLSFGDVPGHEYTMQVFADHLVHAWDLARAIGADDRLDRELVSACVDWFRAQEEGYRNAGVIGPRPPTVGDGDEQVLLLAMFGRAAAG